MLELAPEIEKMQQWKGPRLSGRVTHVIGVVIESQGPQNVFVGELCRVYGRSKEPILCEIVGFKGDKILLMSYGSLEGVVPGAEVYPLEKKHQVKVSPELLGRTLDAWGEPMDGKRALSFTKTYPVTSPPPKPFDRAPIEVPFHTSLRAIDGLCTFGEGQRVGIFSPPGVGKSSLMAQLARNSKADVNVIALVGERGREVREFIERQLGPEGLSKSVVVVATADSPALLRKKGAFVATAIAEYFRDQGKSVLLMMDSLTRFCMALREIGLAVGEPPTQRGYPPSVFATLPQLLERVGNTKKGAITALYTVLTEEENFGDPIPEQIRSLVDGHIMLSKKLSEHGHYPPIDVRHSLSRVMSHLISKEHQELAIKVRKLLSTSEDVQEMLQMGAYVRGANPDMDRALGKKEVLEKFLKQESKEMSSSQEILSLLKELTNESLSF
jgi:flagellum-specific ATP synthase